jgi:pyruvate dehydrogenase E2 component (dihydrolipoamide acetyltransferase)
MAQIPIRMPKMSMTMTEGDVSAWFVSVGDTVAEGDVICEVLTDKVDMEVESPATGVISSIVVEEGTVDVGTPIGYIEGDDSGGFGDLLAGLDESPSEATAEDTPTAAAEVSATASEPVSADGVSAVPRARTLAREQGIDLATVTGSGPAGLIVMADVEAAASPPADPSVPTAATVAAVGTTAPAPTPTPDPEPAGPSTRAPSPPSKRVAQIRARVAAKMTESASVPQFTLWRDLVLDTPNPRRNGVSWTTVLLSAYAAALRQVPELLCRWDGVAAVESGPPAVGLAVATPHGLLAPVIPEPDREDPAELDRRVRAVVATAQTGRIDAAYLQLANGMLSNLGSLGVDRFQALVTPPQGSVLSVGSIRPRPVAVPGGVGTGLSVTVGLTVDHRIADGAHGAQLLAAFVDIVDSWGQSTRET